MALYNPDFFGQGLQSMQAGIGLGNAMQQARLRQQQAQQESELFPLKKQLLEQQSQFEQGKIDSQQDELDRMGFSSGMVMALSAPKNKQVELLQSIKREYGQKPGVTELIDGLSEMDYEDRTAAIIRLLDKTAGGSAYQKGTEGLVFDPRKGTYSVDPIYAENQKQVNAIDLQHKKQIKELEQETALAKERAKGLVEREKADIEDGISAASTMPIMKRASALLDMVDTGKPQQFKLWAKKLFGIESANETELENLLGKQILKQLKPIFGAQFTVREGEWLKDMEAGFGKSREGNRRLVKQGMDLLSQRAKIGLDAATSAKDSRSAKNINDWLMWEFSSPAEQNEAESGSDIKTLSDDDLFNF